MADINELLNSLDPEVLKALMNSNTDELKKAIDNKVEEEKIKEENKNKETTPIMSKTKQVKPRIYHVTIKPDEWEKIDKGWFNSREVYENDCQLREASIISLNIDEDKMYEENGEDIKDEVCKYIDKIYDKALIHIKAKNLIGEFKYIGEDKPKYTICLLIEELPFLDTPASEFGL